MKKRQKRSLKTKQSSLVYKLKLLVESGLGADAQIKNKLVKSEVEPLALPDKIVLITRRLREWREEPKKSEEMVFFVMYDIENDKVRTRISKYLEEKGLDRIQKSIFMGNLKQDVFLEVVKSLKEVQEAYENEDSIIILPIAIDEVEGMRIIGKDINIKIGEEEGGMEWC